VINEVEVVCNHMQQESEYHSIVEMAQEGVLQGMEMRGIVDEIESHLKRRMFPNEVLILGDEMDKAERLIERDEQDYRDMVRWTI